MWRDFSLSSVSAGFVAVLVGFTSSAVIVFQAAEAAGASPAEVSSWIGALCIGMGVTSIGLSLYFRAPMLTAWSTPGAALLATSLSGVPMAEVIGAFVVCAMLITACGISGWFEKAMDRIPQAIAAAMLAGVLLRFGMDVFVAMKTEFTLVLAMFVTYLILKRVSPRYVIVIVLAVGVVLAWFKGLIQVDQLGIAVTELVFTMPAFSWSSVVGIALPLFVVTMASQNVPGVAVIRAAGYKTPISPLISWTGGATLLLAPFGGYALNLAAITAAICMGKEAHEDSSKRYTAAVSAGFFYLLLGVFGATIATLFAAFPKELVLAVAGLALLSTIGSSLATAVKDASNREAALITFLITASGVTLFGIGAAFWGLVGGVCAMFALSPRNKF
jgi:benzoate membrane transport protein